MGFCVLLFTLLVLYNLSSLLYNSLFAINFHKYFDTHCSSVLISWFLLSRGHGLDNITTSVSLLSLLLDVATEMNK